MYLSLTSRCVVLALRVCVCCELNLQRNQVVVRPSFSGLESRWRGAALHAVGLFIQQGSGVRDVCVVATALYLTYLMLVCFLPAFAGNLFHLKIIIQSFRIIHTSKQ